ncbi:ATP-binding protein [Streptosporangium sp. NPDC006013]|uniref:ATP-binding protein n=1 Tax=Streptosporangium sp. NPDC006013 TaxID=3155596 RepID=UPI0033A01996
MDWFDARHDQVANLVGREPEIHRLHLFVSRIAGGTGEALLLAGDPGVGKTSLLNHAATLATGSQFEADISYAALHQLLHPRLGEVPRLSPLLAGALNVALGRGAAARATPGRQYGPGAAAGELRSSRCYSWSTTCRGWTAPARSCSAWRPAA